MTPTITKLDVPATTLGEGLHWDHDQQALFYVNIFDKTINRYKPDRNLHTYTTLQIDSNIHFLIPVEGSKDTFVIGAGHKILIIKWDGENGSAVKIVQELASLDDDKPFNSINDAKIDAKGRLVTGTIGHTDSTFDSINDGGSIFSITNDGKVKVLDKGITVSNGLAWDKDGEHFYHVDTFKYSVRQYEYDLASGEAKNGKVLFDFKKNNLEGFPDGMTIDTEGNLWIACVPAAAIIKVDSKTGILLDKIQMPVKQITSVTFGGQDLDILYVTSGSFEFQGDKPPGGDLFAITGLGVKGYQNRSFKWSAH